MSEAPRFPYVHVDVEADSVDFASGLLFELGAQGVEERDATTLNKPSTARTMLVASFPSREEAEAAIPALNAGWNPRVEEVVGDAWRDAWKEHFRPFALCPGVVVRPPWQAYDGPPVEHVLVLEPGRAFGTGLHETTSLVAEILAAHRSELQGEEILDVGTGSGILALVALLFGARAARAIDVDEDVLGVVRENAERNSLGDRVHCDATPVDDLEANYPLVLANIEAPVLTALRDALSCRVSPGGLLVLSGILAPQAASVVATYPEFTLESAPSKGEWVALALRKGR